MDPVKFEFADGSIETIAAITNGTLRKQQRTKAAAKGQAPYYEDTHALTHNTIRVTQLVDRNLLCIIQDQDKMVCGVKAGLFGEIVDEHAQHPWDHAALKGAGDFMKGIAIDYKSGKLARTELNPERDKRLAAIKNTLFECKTGPRKVADRVTAAAAPKKEAAP